MARPVPAATQTLRVLQYLASQPRPVAAGSMARELGIPRSTLYHLLAAMEAERFVAHLPEERRYGLGVAAFEIGTTSLRHAGLERLAQPLLSELCTRVAATVHLAVLDGREVLYLLEERPPDPAPLVTDVGVRLPAHLTASGRALLAHQPVAHVRALFPDRASLTTRTGRGPQTPGQLLRLLRRVRARGYALEQSQISLGYGSLGMPVFDHTARPVAAVTVTVPHTRPGTEPMASLAAPITATASALTHRLRGVTPDTSNARR